MKLYNDIVKNKKWLFSELKETTINFSELKASQITIFPGHVKGIVSKYDPQKGKGLPWAVKYKDKTWLLDGHHRIAAQSLLGFTETKMDFVNFDKLLNLAKKKAKRIPKRR